MKTFIKRICITSLLLALPCAPALYAGESKGAKAQKNYPNYTADEIWQRLLKTTSVKDGKLTKQMVEKIWGVKLRPNVRDARDSEVNTTLFSITYSHSSFATFAFHWGDGIHAENMGMMHPRSDMCISLSTKIKELQQAGWSSIHRFLDTGMVISVHSFRLSSTQNPNYPSLTINTIKPPSDCILSWFLLQRVEQ